jgi:hypothetical protein
MILLLLFTLKIKTMKNEIEYSGYIITVSCGKYWIEGFKIPYETLREAKEAIDFIEDEALYMQ